ncbi:hypothetical protein HPC49_33235 [Pyxidicoccus fallax]|uniref:Uncharacterized protein n=1 Tax=Pyxidicoccus fallax TaxID=394095 RepID=A0A848LEN1_9BACT|nr:hypothetical protein [Pyxidicoccus fallax]NMO14711.1 hypothetical protein [Pyxidicoccus fallax]NPC83072.1 hypothetical protein [Pyxidicoccus fallax]
MPDMLAIISKAVFEKEAPGKQPGDVLPMDRYRSNSKYLEPLAQGGRLFLVTVRPPNEALWLVAVLEGLKSDEEGWRARSNRVPITDLTALIPQIRFESGKGIQAAKGALGMSLQTPRALSAADAELMLQAAGGANLSGPTNLTAHEEHPKLACLCRRCLPNSPERAETGGLTFVRSKVETGEKVLYYWLPEELSADAKVIAQSVRGALARRANL